MRPMPKSTPVILLGMLAGGWLIFSLNAFFPVPIETWFAIAGMLLFVAGLLFGLFGFFRGPASLRNADARRSSGIAAPVVTMLIAVTSWSIVVYTAIEMKRSLDERAQFEQEHWDELYGTNTETETSQPAPGLVPSKAAADGDL